MYYPIFDSTILILIPAIVIAAIAQFKVKAAFDRYSAVRSSRGATAQSVCRDLLDRFGLSDVRIEHVPGELSDHYDPAQNVLRLSDSVRASSSIAAIGVAAHEVGHAIQHSEGYAPLRFRNTFVPIANIGSSASWPLFLIGLLMSLEPLLIAGIVLFTAVVIFHLVTLPVEFDASSRALKILSSTNALTSAELDGAKSVLSAAALTYVAAAIMSAAQLLRLLILARRRSR